jgi:hypothetical protein
MYWDAISVKPLHGHILTVVFSDGLQGTIVFEPSHFTGVFEPLKFESLFNYSLT